jgi:hypothetical protein
VDGPGGLNEAGELESLLEQARGLEGSPELVLALDQLEVEVGSLGPTSWISWWLAAGIPGYSHGSASGLQLGLTALMIGGVVAFGYPLIPDFPRAKPIRRWNVWTRMWETPT